MTRISVRVGSVPLPPEAGAAVRWIFSVTNTGQSVCTLMFPSGQTGDVTLRSGGAERYRWSAGRLFAAVVTERDLGPGETWTFELADTLSVGPGVYSLLGTVTANPAPPPALGTVAVA